jgi:hypothetical protein
MNIKLVITKKSNAKNVAMFERSAKIFPVTFVKQGSDGKVLEITNIKSLVIERRGF